MDPSKMAAPPLKLSPIPWILQADSQSFAHGDRQTCKTKDPLLNYLDSESLLIRFSAETGSRPSLPSCALH
jgi:hypothetical protein